MKRVFSTAGPCDPERHYMLPPERRIQGLRQLIDTGKYFVVHAPSLVGKIMALLEL